MRVSDWDEAVSQVKCAGCTCLQEAEANRARHTKSAPECVGLNQAAPWISSRSTAKEKSSTTA